ncbi:EthD family reductase [Aliifodinibius sp. S!AR15-10]|uniref:EthD family reductase n=1 Tax=Aliifodinibius sp. S!AR15-10 TaxID=2950437 RepID=UPI0028664D9F|nr:EthD family reductase [Aliifodinibius sp. S!AR15-10]MDR8393616.1 EthD family reductase [Aliifodinibius sp. S!AR15-10]
MYRLTVIYASKEEGHFDFDYYVNTHLPLVLPLIGESVVRTEVARGIEGVGDEESPPCTATVQLYLKNLDGLKAAFENHGDEIMDDVPKFTNIKPVLNIEELVSS